MIFLAIVVLCGAYLVPAALRHRKAVASARVGDRNSGSIRVVVARAAAARPEPAAVAGGRAALVAPSSRPMLTSGPTPAATQRVSSAVGVAARATARPGEPRVRHRARPSGASVVRRRRRLLALVSLLVPAGLGCAAAGLLPWVVGVATVAAPLALLVLFVRQPAVRAGARPAVVPATPTARTVPVVREPLAATAPVVTPPVAGSVVPAQREHPGATAGAAGAAGGPGATGEPDPASAPTPAPTLDPAVAGWAPVPVPLPTYLLKPKAEPVLAPVAPAPPAAVEETVVIDLREPARAVNA